MPQFIELVGTVSNNALVALKDNLIHCRDFSVYREVFNQIGISRTDITRDPLTVLKQLPILNGARFTRLIDESLQLGDRIIDLETSSGTKGPKSHRFISSSDDDSDHEFLAELFAVCGIGRLDRVACLDIDPVNLMGSFTKALDLLGVEESYVYCVGREFETDVAGLRRLDPTVIITIPTLIERCFESLSRVYVDISKSSLRNVVYFGETLFSHTRWKLESVLGVNVFGYYGATETSSLGIECSNHNGIHVFTDRNVIEIMSEDAITNSGEIVITSLHQKTLPLLRYALGDMIVADHGPCPCGLSLPRVEVVGRVGDSFSVLGLKIHFKQIWAAVYEQFDLAESMQIIVSRDDKDVITVVLPHQLQYLENSVRGSLLGSESELDFLVSEGYIRLEFFFAPDEYFNKNRKRKRVVDKRG